MARTKALMVRFAVEISLNGSAPKKIQDIIAINGLDLGKEGTIEVPEWDRNVQISDGKKKLSDLGVKFRINEGSDTFKFFLDMWKDRANAEVDIDIIITKRNWEELYRYKATGCEMLGFKGDDQELGSPKLGINELVFAPYDMDIDTSSAGTVFSWS